MSRTPKNSQERLEVRIILAITGMLMVFALNALIQQAIADHILESSRRWQVGLILLALVTVIDLALFLFTFTRLSGALISARGGFRRSVAFFGRLRFVLVPMMLILPTASFILIREPFLLGIELRLLLVWLVVLVSSEAILATKPQGGYVATVFSLLVSIGVIHSVVIFLVQITNYPFSLGWSEASRYYYASLFWADHVYGNPANPSVLHPSRYLMQSFPFIFSGVPIWFHRLWQVCLWLSTLIFTGIGLARRLDVRSQKRIALVTGFVFIYLMQGPVYYHLLIMVILILFGMDVKRPGRSTAIVLVASIWAGISRLNWFPIPGMLASAIWFLEVRGTNRSVQDYFRFPALWSVGGALIAFVTQFAYIRFSGQPPEQFGTSFTSDLLWYRLLPNATFSMGILPAILVASLPVIYLIWISRGALSSGLKAIRIVGVSTLLVLLLGGGLLVSVKIGGGSNLHNLDGYLVLLGLMAGYLFFGRIASEGGSEPLAQVNSQVFLSLAILVPLIFTLSQGKPVRYPDESESSAVLQAIQEEIYRVTEIGGDILFISQRHLLSMGMILDVNLIEDYETVFLMEMAMSRNRAYLDRLHNDLKQHRFEMIIVERLNTVVQDRSHNFAEENNAWVEEVSRPILCHYEPVLTFSAPPLQILLPADFDPACK
jgi:hypothetical protein